MLKAQTSPVLTAPHGFFSREGGVSSAPYRGLNCGPGSDDNPASVAENRRLVAAHVSGAAHTPLLSCYQRHGSDTVTIGPEADLNWSAERPEADAMATDRPGIILGILTADCTPILLQDEAAGVIGAAHAGWRGAAFGITGSVVEAMQALGAEASRITAAIGPSIQRQSFEVRADMLDKVRAAKVETGAEIGAEADQFIAAGKDGDHFHFDLPGFVASRLAACGVTSVWQSEHDTYADERYFSYRRMTHEGGGDYGRQISAIMLPVTD